MRVLFFLMLSVGVSLPALAQRACDSSRKEFFTATNGFYEGMKPSQASLSCAACAMENSEELWNRKKVNVTDFDWDTKFNNTADISDRYWAMIAVAARQFYNVEDKGEISKEELLKVMIRLSTALGPCRRYFVDPSKPLLTELHKNNKGPKGYKVNDLSVEEALNLSSYASAQKAYVAALTNKERSAYQKEISQSLGFKSNATLPDLLVMPKNFHSMTHQELRKHLKKTFQKLDGGDFIKSEAGRAMNSCVEQLKVNLHYDKTETLPPAQLCEAMTRSCFGDSPQKLHEICDSHGLHLPKQSPPVQLPQGPSVPASGHK